MLVIEMVSDGLFHCFRSLFVGLIDRTLTSYVESRFIVQGDTLLSPGGLQLY